MANKSLPPTKFDLFTSAEALGISPEELLSFWDFSKKELKVSCHFTKGIVIKSKDDVVSIVKLYRTLFIAKKDFIILLRKVLLMIQTRSMTKAVLEQVKENDVAEVTIINGSQINGVKFAANVRRVMPEVQVEAYDTEDKTGVRVLFYKGKQKSIAA